VIAVRLDPIFRRRGVAFHFHGEIRGSVHSENTYRNGRATEPVTCKTARIPNEFVGFRYAENDTVSPAKSRPRHFTAGHELSRASKCGVFQAFALSCAE